MPERLTFTLTGRDELSRVLNGTADSADRLRLRLAGITADSDGQLRDLQGRYVSVADAQRRLAGETDNTRHSFAGVRDEAGKLGKAIKANLISLAPAAIPAAAGLASSAAAVAGQFGAAAVAAGVYALALGPQIGAITEALDAQTKYEEAVRTSGKTSQEAVKAQLAYQQQLEEMPQATREAAVAVGLLKDNYQEWSDSLAGDVMAPFTKGIAVANALLPKTSGLVRGASTQFDRLITLVGGGISTPGFDRLNDEFTDFSEKTLRHGVDELTQFLAKLNSGQVNTGGINEFFDYAKANGPAVWDTLENVGSAVLHILEAGSGVGVGMLDLINALSGVVSAVPPDAIADLLQLAIAIKAVRLAAAGSSAARAALLALGTQVGALRTASAGAPGAISGVTAAIGGLSRGAKVALAGTGLGLLLITLDSLSTKSKKPQPDVDKLTHSVAELGKTGKVSGEALRVYGSDLGGLADALQVLAKPSGLDKTQQFLTGLIGMDSTPVKDAKDAFNGLDEALAGLVSEGKADLAAAALDNIEAKLRKQGFTSKEVEDQLDDYKDALAAQAFEQQLAAESMGLFGDQAQKVQAKLEEQKSSADGLRQSIQALNDVNRQGLSGMIGFEAAIDAASKAAQENAGVLDMQNGKLTLGTEKQRAAAQALNDLAAKTDEAAGAARESGASWSEVNGIYEQGRQALIRSAEQMGLTRAQAKRLADQILQTPDKTAKLKGNLEDLKAKLADAKQRLKSVPDSRKAKVRADIAQLKSQISYAERQLAILNGRTVTVYINGKATGVNASQYYSQGPHKAGGGLIRGYADGGDVVQLIPFGGLVFGPGTETSDSVPAWLSRDEYVIRASAVRRYGVSLFDALNAERFAGGGYAGGGFTYSANRAQLATSTVSNWYDQDVQRLKDAWTKLNEALRAQAKHSTAATRKAVADARAAVNAADKALGLKAGSKVSGFSLTGYATNLSQAVKASDTWEKNLSKIGKRAGADIEETLRGMGEAGRSMVAALATASNKQFNAIVKNLQKLGPTAAATLADYTKQLNNTTASSKKFQDNLLKLASQGYGDLAMQLAGQGDADAMAIAAGAVKSPSAAKKANAALQANGKLLSTEELTAAATMMGVLAKKGATVEDVVAAGVSWPMLVSLAPRYVREIKALAGGNTFAAGMRDRGVMLAGGGLLLGPGTPTSDSIPLWGSTGEYMIKAAAVAKYGVRFMDALNEGRLPAGRAARPGLPAAPVHAAPVAGSDRPAVTYNVYPRASVISAADLQLITRQEEARQRVGRAR